MRPEVCPTSPPWGYCLGHITYRGCGQRMRPLAARPTFEWPCSMLFTFSRVNCILLLGAWGGAAARVAGSFS